MLIVSVKPESHRLPVYTMPRFGAHPNTQKVSPAQMRALQMLRERKLIWRASTPGLFDISIQPLTAWALAPVTAKILVDNAWVELKKFSARQGEYRLTPAGRDLTELLCRCSPAKTELTDFILLSGVDPSTTKKHNWSKERLLCMNCWRLARCAYVTRPRRGVIGVGPSHAANRWAWGVGPICVRHSLAADKRG